MQQNGLGLRIALRCKAGVDATITGVIGLTRMRKNSSAGGHPPRHLRRRSQRHHGLKAVKPPPPPSPLLPKTTSFTPIHIPTRRYCGARNISWCSIRANR